MNACRKGTLIPMLVQFHLGEAMLLSSVIEATIFKLLMKEIKIETDAYSSLLCTRAHHYCKW